MEMQREREKERKGGAEKKRENRRGGEKLRKENGKEVGKEMQAMNKQTYRERDG